MNIGIPLLALESTVIAHGLPYPQNLETARALERVAREHGAEPRTLAIIGGEIKIGLSDDELKYLAQANDVLKLSRRDIAVAIAQQRDGATTVSATMWLAHRAGIRVFATGGIGGVHRAVGVAQSWDVSADLLELAQTPVAVVCAGAKAILDIPATLEFLETHGVPVIGYQTDEFPAFYSRSSGVRAQTRVDSAEEAARVIKTHWDLGFTSGVLIGVPIPHEYETPREVIEPFIERALREAEEQEITGNAVTPFLLKRLAELTQGESVKTNVALLKNNVAVAAEIAKALDIATRAAQA
jgi:pseudouridine-5'-phosphate glycosidase